MESNSPQKTVFILVGTNDKLNKIYLERISAGKSAQQFKIGDLDKDSNLVVSNTVAKVFFSSDIKAKDVSFFEKLISDNSAEKAYQIPHFFAKAPAGTVTEIEDPLLVISCDSLTNADKEYFETMEHVSIYTLTGSNTRK